MYVGYPTQSCRSTNSRFPPFATVRWGPLECPLRAVKAILCSQWNGGNGGDSGPSRGDSCTRGFRPFEAVAIDAHRPEHPFAVGLMNPRDLKPSASYGVGTVAPTSRVMRNTVIYINRRWITRWRPLAARITRRNRSKTSANAATRSPRRRETCATSQDR